MNWMRYQGSTRRPSRRDRERWVRERLKEAIELKREQIRLGIRPKLARTSIDPKESYFLRRLIHLDKSTGGVTWKLFEDSPSTQSEISSSYTSSSSRPLNLDRSGTTPPKASKKRPLPSFNENIEYSHNTQSLAHELRSTAADEKQWVARMMEVSDTEEENSDSDSCDSETSTVTSPSAVRERPRVRRARGAARNPSTPRKSFSAKEIYAMLPTDSPNLKASIHPRRKRKATKKRKEQIVPPIVNRPAIASPNDSPPEFRLPFKRAKRDEYRELSAQESESQSILASETSDSSGRRSEAALYVSNSVSGSVSETVSSCSESDSSSEASLNSTASSPDLAVRRIESSSELASPLPTKVSDPAVYSSRSASGISSPRSTEANCGSAASFSSNGVGAAVPQMSPASIDVTIPFLPRFDVPCGIEAKREISTNFNGAPGAGNSRRESVAPFVQANAADRGSFASRTSIPTKHVSFGPEQPVSAFAIAARSDPWLEVKQRVETDQQVNATKGAASERLIEDGRSALASVAKIPPNSGELESAGTRGPAAASMLSASRPDFNNRVKFHQVHAVPAVEEVAPTRRSTKPPEVHSARSVAVRLRNPAANTGKTDSFDSPVSVATTVLFRDHLNARLAASTVRQTLRDVSDVSRSARSNSSLFTSSGDSRSSVRSIRKGSHMKKKNSRRKQGVKTSPDLSYLPGLFLSPKIGTSSFHDAWKASYPESPTTGNGTQTFTSSLAEE